MVKFCPTCGKLLPFENAEICPNCGVRIKSPIESKESKIGKYLIIGIGLFFGFIVLAAVLSYVVSGAGFFTTQKSSETIHTSTSIPSNSSTPSVSPSTQFTHTPSEIIQGHLNSSEYKIITTYIRDPQTFRYTIKLVGPDTADFDLYVKKGMEVSSNNYDYKSTGYKSSEQIDIFNPTVDDYNILIKSTRGNGDYVLYIDYEYNNAPNNQG